MNRVQLPLTEPRCYAAAEPCTRKWDCERYIADRAHGAPLADFSGTVGGCKSFIRLGTLKAPTAEPTGAKPWPSYD